MHRLQQALLNRYEGKKIEVQIYFNSTHSNSIQVLTPKNCQTVRLQYRGEKMAKVVGSIAQGGAEHLKKISGILIQNDYQYMYLIL